MENHSWTPRQMAEEITLPQLFVTWAAPPDAPDVLTNPSREEQLEIFNRLRAKAGKPPLAPEGVTDS